MTEITTSTSPNSIPTTRMGGEPGYLIIRHDLKNRNQIWMNSDRFNLLTKDQAITMAQRLVELVDEMERP